MKIDFTTDINLSYETALNYKAIDRFVVKVLWVELPVFGLLVFTNSVLKLAASHPGPLGWRVISPYEAILAMAVALVATLVPTLLKGRIRNHYLWRVIVTVALAMYSYLFVFVGGGSIEMHFHFFIVVILLAVYADWRLGWLLLFLLALYRGILDYAQPDWVFELGKNNTSTFTMYFSVFVAVVFSTIICNRYRESIVVLKRSQDNLEKTSRELVTEQARLTASIEGLTAGFLLIDLNGGIVIQNKALQTIFGQSGPLTDLDQLNNGLNKLDLMAIAQKVQTSHKAYDVKEINAGPKILHIFAAPVAATENGKHVAVGAVILVEDITEAKIMDRSKDEFFSIASHELRTPLTSIKGNSSMILDFYKEVLKDPALKEMVEDMHTSAVRLIEIVNDFLDLSRLEQGKMSFDYAPVSAEKVIESVVYEMEAVLSEKKLHLKVDTLTLDKLPPVWADENRLKQVVYNLVGNAAKFTEKGSISISAKLDPTKKLVKILVTDTGRGMTPESQQLLFRKFQQASSSLLTRDTTRGTGLGLYISKMIIENMGGSITLEESIEGKGTTFSFTVPIATPERQAALKPSAKTDSTTGLTTHTEQKVGS